jgi:hypothetical protein
MLARGRQGKTVSKDRGRVRARRLLLLCGAVIAIVLGYAAVSALALPTFSAPPEVQGAARLGERLVCGSGSWSGEVTKFEYEWVRAGAIVKKGTVTYTLSKEDEGKEVWCIVKATNREGTSEAESWNSVEFGKPVQEVAPESKTSPKVSGEAKVGASLTCTPGTWTGTEPITLSYSWLRTREAKKEPINGQTTSSYTVQQADAGYSISCKVTAKNNAGEAFKESENNIPIGATGPGNTTKPEILPESPSVGETVTCKEGTWSGSTPLTFKYKWLRNTSTEISGAIAQTYIVHSADEGQTLTCKVTAENPAGKAEASSAAITVASGLVSSVSPPIISPSEKIKVPTALTCSNGTWLGAPSEFKYKWFRGASEIAGATSSKYTTQSADKGQSLICEVTAKHNSSEASETSAPTAVCSGTCASAPTPNGQPVIEGVAKLNQTLKCANTSWTGSPTKFNFLWLRDGTPISQAEANTYTVKEADQGHELFCQVTAVNAEGSGTAVSEGIHIAGVAPSDVTAPEVIGQLRVGEALTCAHGEWHGLPAPTFTYVWKRDGAQVGSGVAYALTSEDRGHTLVCEVTAFNGEGSPVTVSSAGKHLEGSAPEPTREPEIGGEAKVGAELSCTQGEWAGAPTPTFTYQWLLGGAEVAGATGKTFTVGSSARGLIVSCRVTGSNTEGTKSATSKGLHIPGTKPEAIELPSISGTPSVGFTLTCNRGIWSGKPPPSFTYQWLREGVPIAGATGGTYVVEAGDAGHLLTCTVLGSNAEGSLEVESTNGAVIAHGVGGKTGGGGGTVTGGGTPVVPTAAQILSSLKRQLAGILNGAHIKSVLKAGSYTFTFNSPTAGKFELTLYVKAKGAQGSKRSKPVVVARTNASFTRASRSKIKLTITKSGRHELKGKKKVSLSVKAVFSVPHKSPVTATLVLTLKR